MGMRIVNYHDTRARLPPGDHWLMGVLPKAQEFDWVSFSNTPPAWLRRLPKSYALGNLSGAVSAVRACRDRDLLITHGPRPAAYSGLVKELAHSEAHHLAFAFNFTTLPEGTARRWMAKGLSNVNRFVVFSTLERRLYAKHFDLDSARFDMLHWAVKSPLEHWPDLVMPDPPPYIAAVGSQGRDYGVLAEAMRLLPSVKLKLVAWPSNVAGIDLPSNVELHANIPLEQSMRILANAAFLVLPLRDENTPCGHVTLVHAMHLGKAIVTTRSSGTQDYLRHGENAIVVEPGDSRGLARAIERLTEEPAEAVRLGAAGQEFAAGHCTEAVTARYLSDYIGRLLGSAGQSVGNCAA